MPKYRINPGWRGAGEVHEYTEHEAAGWPTRVTRVADDTPVTKKQDGAQQRQVASDDQLTHLGEAVETAPTVEKTKKAEVPANDVPIVAPNGESEPKLESKEPVTKKK